MQKAILFDLDNTLIDTKIRHYSIYSDFLYARGITPLLFHEYLDLRKNGYSNKEIIARHSEGLGEQFTPFWSHSIEQITYLEKDENLVHIDLLQSVKSTTKAFFFLVSLRSNRVSAEKQFEGLPFARFFEKAIFLPHSQSKNPKTSVIRNLKDDFEINFFIGDSNTDYEAAIQNNLTFLGVQTGWKYLEVPSSYDDINELFKKAILTLRVF